MLIIVFNLIYLFTTLILVLPLILLFSVPSDLLFVLLRFWLMIWIWYLNLRNKQCPHLHLFPAMLCYRMLRSSMDVVGKCSDPEAAAQGSFLGNITSGSQS